jgi:hypothetical protein
VSAEPQVAARAAEEGRHLGGIRECRRCAVRIGLLESHPALSPATPRSSACRRRSRSSSGCMPRSETVSPFSSGAKGASGSSTKIRCAGHENRTGYSNATLFQCAGSSYVSSKCSPSMRLPHTVCATSAAKRRVASMRNTAMSSWGLSSSSRMAGTRHAPPCRSTTSMGSMRTRTCVAWSDRYRVNRPARSIKRGTAQRGEAQQPEGREPHAPPEPQPQRGVLGEPQRVSHQLLEVAPVGVLAHGVDTRGRDGRPLQ